MNLRRIPQIIVGTLLLLFLGLIYAWSIFVAPLENEFGWLRSQTSLTFTICMSCFCLGGIAGGFVTKRFGSRVTMLISAVLLFAGFFLTSRADSLTTLYLCYGVLCGLGIGLSYNAVIGTVGRWFPDRPGLCSGILLMGFGFGSFLLGTAASALIEKLGWRETFVYFAVAFAAVVVIAALVIRAPRQEETAAAAVKKSSGPAEQGLDLTVGKMLRRPSFWLLFFWSVILSAAGMSVIGVAKPFAASLGAAAAAATTAVGVISIANGLSRVIIGWVFDHLGRRKVTTLVACLFVAAFGTLLLAVKLSSVPVMFAGLVLTGLSYGGVPTLNVAIVRRLYGSRNYATNFSFMNGSLIPAALLGPYIAGLLYDASGGYASTLLLFIGLCALAGVLGLLAKKA